MRTNTITVSQNLKTTTSVEKLKQQCQIVAKLHKIKWISLFNGMPTFMDYVRPKLSL